MSNTDETCKAHENCLICVDGRCHESLDDGDVCIECRAVAPYRDMIRCADPAALEHREATALADRAAHSGSVILRDAHAR